MTESAALLARVYSRVRRQAPPPDTKLNTDCWIFTGAPMTSGHAQIRVHRRLTLVHRITYEATVGPIPSHLQIDHLCKQRMCANPSHLEAVDSRTNTLRGDGITARNARKTACSRGHSFTADNTRIRRGWRECLSCEAIRRKAR